MLSDPFTTGLLGLLAMFVLIFLQVPVGIAMGIVGVVGCGLIIGFAPALTLLATEPSSSMASESFAVVAMFLLMGNLAHVGGLSRELYRLAHVYLGHKRGGLIFATIGACAGFGAICGSSVATAATMARIALPEMLERGYAKSLAAGSIAAGGTLGMIVPPSVVMILYAILTENSIIALFLAAIVPGLLAVLVYFVAVYFVVRANPDAAPVGPKASWRERRQVTGQGWAVVLLAVIVSGGIYSGIFTVSEAASVGATVALLLALFRRRLTVRKFLAALGDTAANTGMIFIMIIGASVFSYFATLSGLPMATVDWIQSLALPPLLVLCLLMVFYLILGAIFDTIAAMVLTLPFVYPLIIGLGYDPVWWGVINIVVIELGMITPPIGINVFVLHGMARDLPLSTIFRGVVPFIIADVVRLVILILFPPLSLWLPGVLGWL
ncbi:TRAP transporter large permease [Pseudooceanicola sediminis]|uniref:TRAP transporter large permease protein n=1 Tax=Pseudooceanicola sediminis TaxID=2211117 RepID=A0A399IWV7_9RHOB|nr:TRAP transporter large permease [Pseudooceanicola sediminis]KAA2312965.1 TRAP transporter large permease [Puniceibacterium sp. HSS470]RII37635.1 TRAP transporter large permease [Pseudooceanicola sediminis]|tara:strand:+ start:5385 stop:6698 length:1314 start_codon:yes stop_codon:yes gene_type:complete